MIPENNATLPFDLEEVASEDALQPPSEDLLQRISAKGQLARAIDLEISDLESRLEKKKSELRDIKERDLVALLDEAGISMFDLPAVGNNPPYELRLKPYYHAVIPKDDPDSAFGWLETHEHGDLIKYTFTIRYGRGEEEDVAKFRVLLNQCEFVVDYEEKREVPWNTLTAFIKEQIETYGEVLPLKTLGATVGRIVDVKEKKEKVVKKRSK